MATSGITVSVMEQSIRSIGKRSRPVWVIFEKKSKRLQNTVFYTRILPTGIVLNCSLANISRKTNRSFRFTNSILIRRMQYLFRLKFPNAVHDVVYTLRCNQQFTQVRRPAR